MDPFSVLALGASIPAPDRVQEYPVVQEIGANADLDIPNISEIKSQAGDVHAAYAMASPS